MAAIISIVAVVLVSTLIDRFETIALSLPACLAPKRASRRRRR